MNVAVFTSPYDRDRTEQIVADVIRELKGTYNGNVGKWKPINYLTFSRTKVRFFYGKLESGTAVRVVFDSIAPVRAWHSFITVLNSRYGNKFGLSDKVPHDEIAVLTIQDQKRQIYVSKNVRSPSLLGFLVGGAAFGEAGAIIGGLSGRQQTYTELQEYDNGLVDAEVLCSDGIIREETFRKDSDFYNNWIMGNLG